MLYPLSYEGDGEGRDDSREATIPGGWDSDHVDYAGMFLLPSITRT